MGFFSELSDGFSYYGKAHKFIVQNKLWLYVILPGIVNLILMSFVIWLGFHYSNTLLDWLYDIVVMNSQMNSFLKVLLSIVYFFLSLFLKLLVIIIYMKIYRYLVLIVISPAMSLLSEKVDTIITGKTYPFVFSIFLKNISRSILITLRNIFKEILINIGLFFLSFIPIIGLFVPFVIFYYSFFYLGFSMIDYSSERKGLNISQSVKYVKSHRGLAVAIGSCFYLLLMIPVVGILLTPSYSVVAATLATQKYKL